MYSNTLKSKLCRYISVLFFISIYSSVYAVELVKEIYPGGGSPTSITDVNGRAFFLSRTNRNIYTADNFALWRSDGTEAGTQFIKDLDIPDRHGTYVEFTAFKGGLFFRGSGDSGGGAELWKSDRPASRVEMIMV